MQLHKSYLCKDFILGYLYLQVLLYKLYYVYIFEILNICMMKIQIVLLCTLNTPAAQGSKEVLDPSIINERTFASA